MNDTLHSRHHSTVLPRLCTNRKESQHNLHTYAIDSAIQLQGTNRVLKKYPPPISDKEQRLNRRQRCTLSQLRSGHCHLLQYYKHRVLEEPSDICTDCGIRWDQFMRLAISTTETLTDLKTVLVVANNSNTDRQRIDIHDYVICCTIVTKHGDSDHLE